MSGMEMETARSLRLFQKELECPPTRLNVCAPEFAGTPEQQVHHLYLSLSGLTELPFDWSALSAGLAPSGSRSPYKAGTEGWWRSPLSFSQQSTARQPGLLQVHGSCVPAWMYTLVFSFVLLFWVESVSRGPLSPAGLVQPLGAVALLLPWCCPGLSALLLSATSENLRSSPVLTYSPCRLCLKCISAGLTQQVPLGQGPALPRTVAHTKASQIGLFFNEAEAWHAITAARREAVA